MGEHLHLIEAALDSRQSGRATYLSVIGRVGLFGMNYFDKACSCGHSIYIASSVRIRHLSVALISAFAEDLKTSARFGSAIERGHCS